MEFEYDPKKSISNLLKHGIDFMRAQRLWDSPTVEVSVNGDYGEERFAVFGVIEGEELNRNHYLSRRQYPHHFCKAIEEE